MSIECTMYASVRNSFAFHIHDHWSGALLPDEALDLETLQQQLTEEFDAPIEVRRRGMDIVLSGVPDLPGDKVAAVLRKYYPTLLDQPAQWIFEEDVRLAWRS